MALKMPLVLQSCEFEDARLGTWHTEMHLVSMTHTACRTLIFYATIYSEKIKKKACDFGNHSRLKHLNYPVVLCVGFWEITAYTLGKWMSDIYQLQPATFHEAVLSSLPLANGAETKFQPDYFYQSFSSVCLLIFIAENGFEFSDQSLLNEGMIKKVASYVPPLGAIIIVLQPIGPPEP